MVGVIISISSQFNLSILREFVIFWIYRTRSRFEIRFIQIVNIRGNSVQYRYDIKEWNYRVSFIYIYIYSDSPCISIDKNIIYFFQSSSNFIGNDQEGEDEVFETKKKKRRKNSKNVFLEIGRAKWWALILGFRYTIAIRYGRWAL